MKLFRKTLLAVTLITGICTFLLVIVSTVTAEPIATAKQNRALAASRAVLPADFESPSLETLDGEEFYISRTPGGDFAGLAVRGRSKEGYGGDIVIMAGFTADNRLYTYAVLEQSETPGLGVKIAKPAFKEQLEKRPLASLPWKVTKDGGDVAAITAATISSRAALEAVADAAAKFAAYRNANP